MKLLVGLGNPGHEYAKHRHNVGFMVLDELMRRAGATPRTRFKGEVARALIGRTDVVLLKPMTFMNNSGISVGQCANFFKISPQDTVIIHDELDLEYGLLRVKPDGGHAGHNGLRSIFQHFSPGDFPRIRVGIGRPKHGSVSNYVLSDFTPDEGIELDRIVDSAADAVETIIKDDVKTAMNSYNRRQSGGTGHSREEERSS
jgi:PTH1 family peptidyl-tRNA hydrolase